MHDPLNPQSPEDVDPDVLGALRCTAQALTEIAALAAAAHRAAEACSTALDHLARLDPALLAFVEETAGEEPPSPEPLLTVGSVGLSMVGDELILERGPRSVSSSRSDRHE